MISVLLALSVVIAVLVVDFSVMLEPVVVNLTKLLFLSFSWPSESHIIFMMWRQEDMGVRARIRAWSICHCRPRRRRCFSAGTVVKKCSIYSSRLTSNCSGLSFARLKSSSKLGWYCS